MTCWFHKWSKWGDVKPMELPDGQRWSRALFYIQMKLCEKCGMTVHSLRSLGPHRGVGEESVTEEEIRFVADMEQFVNRTSGTIDPAFVIDTDVQRLCRIIRTYEKILAEGQVIRGRMFCGQFQAQCVHSVVYEHSLTHRARLVQIEEITPSPAQSDK